MGVETLLLSLPNVGLKVSGTGQRTEDVGSWEVPAASPGVRGTVQQGSPPPPRHCLHSQAPRSRDVLSKSPRSLLVGPHLRCVS